MFKAEFCIIFLTIFYAETIATDKLCHQNLCTGSTEHIGCIKNARSFSPKCGKNNKVITINSGLRSAVLLQLNTARNYVASGSNSNLKPAARMPVLKWDKDLANLASLTLRQCDFEQRFCQRMPKFATVSTTQVSKTLGNEEFTANSLIEAVQMWFVDFKGCKMDDEDHIVAAETGKCVGHYKSLIQDQGAHVGCALLIKEEKKNNTMRMICNFSRGKKSPDVVYQVGKTPGEKCKMGVNPKFIFLCADDEPVNEK